MIQVVITYLDEFKHYSYVCTAEGAFELWFNMRSNPHIRKLEIKSMNGTLCEMSEHDQPLHGIHSIYNLISHVNVK